MSQASTELDVSNASRGVWLVKVPKYISNKWEKASPMSEIGRLKIKKGPGGKPEILFDLSQELVEDGKGSRIPKEHQFALNDIYGQHLAVFSNDKDDKGSSVLTLEGNVMQKGECRPIGDKNYMTLKVRTIVDARKPTREVKQLDKAVVVYKPIASHRADVEFEQKKKVEGKKSRDDKSKVMDMVFSAFEKKQYYSLKNLHTITNQPVAFLKEILREICVYNKKNSKHMWELKPEYRHYNQTDEGGEGSKA